MIGRKKWKDKTKNKRNAINVGGGILNRRCEAFLLTHQELEKNYLRLKLQN